MNNIDLILDSIKEDKERSWRYTIKSKNQGQEIINTRETEAKKEAEDLVANAQNQAELLIKKLRNHSK